MIKKKSPLYIRAWREHLGLSVEQIREAAGKEQSVVYRYETGAANPPADVLKRIADRMGLDVGALYYPPPAQTAEGGAMQDPGSPFTAQPDPESPQAGGVRLANVPLPNRRDMPRDVPVLGTAAGSLKGAFVMDGVVDYVRRPPGLDGAVRAYSLYVEGDSMSPQHPSGELRFIHPNRPVHPGDSVILQIKPGPEEPIQAFIKNLVKRDSRKITVEQLNPPKLLEFDVQEVISMHKVLTLNDLFEV